MKVLFLDFDGVLNSEQFVRVKILTGTHNGIEDLCPYAVANLRYILGAVPDLKIVISSTWRVLYPLAVLRHILKEAGVEEVDSIIDTTTKNHPGPRGAQIDLWLKDRNDVESFVILDDDNDMEPHMSRLVRTNSQNGLTLVDAKQAVSLLTGKSIEEVRLAF